MIKRIVFLCIAAVLTLWLGVAPHALADDPNRFSQLTIRVQPEYDQQPSQAKPIVLVILEGTLADATNFPREVSLLLPPGATVWAATYKNADGSPAPEQPVQSTGMPDGFTRVTYSIRSAQVYFEYYHDLLRGAPDKTMDFVFKAPAPVDQLTLEIQQPLKATNFSVNPPVQKTSRGADGFQYYTSQFSNVTAGQSISTQVKYTKTDPAPSFVAPPPATPVPASASAQTASSPSTDLFLLIALVVLGLTAVLGFFLYQQRARQMQPARITARPPRRSKRKGSTGPEAASIFCTQCGNTLGPDANFCPKCGAPRRIVE